MFTVVSASAVELQCGRFENLRLDWCCRILIEFMNSPEQPFKPLLIDDDTVFKLIEDKTISVKGRGEIVNPGLNSFTSNKEFIDKLANSLLCLLSPQAILEKGLKARVLEPGKTWVTGKIRLRLVVEFIPDELENNGTLDKFASSLDELRSKNL